MTRVGVHWRWLVRQWMGWSILCWLLVSMQLLEQRGVSIAATVQQWVWTPWVQGYSRMARALHRVWITWRDARRLAEENRRLQELLRYYQRMEYEYVQILRELQIFSPLYERWRRDRPLQPLIWARVIVPLDGPMEQPRFLIDRGRLHGVTRWSAVLGPHGLVGIVAQTGPATAQVRPVIHPRFRCGIQVGDRGPLGILYGTGDFDTTIVRFIPRSARIARASIVTTSGLEGVLPAGIPVGTIVRRQVLDTGEVIYRVRPVESAFQVRWVAVIPRVSTVTAR